MMAIFFFIHSLVSIFGVHIFNINVDYIVKGEFYPSSDGMISTTKEKP